MSLKEFVKSALHTAGYVVIKRQTFEELLAAKAALEKKPEQHDQDEQEDPYNGRTLQDVAIEDYLKNPPKTPPQFYPFQQAILLSPSEVAKALTIGVMYVNTSDVKGDIAEFGTMSGFSAKIIANAMMYDPQRQPSYPFRRLRLFDSFEGLPDITADADKRAPQVLSGAWSKGGCCVLSALELYELVTKILPPERIEITEGWFADTVKQLPDDTRFAMIHFDGDLYQSMIDAMTPCFQRGFISRGAVLCLDDWNCNQADPSFGERKAWAELVETFDIKASSQGDYGETGTKFIIHSYKGML